LNNGFFRNTIVAFLISGILIFITISATGLIIHPTEGNNDVCFACHDDPDLTMDRNGKQVSIYVSSKLYEKSVHSGNDCTDCHLNYDPNNIPHTKTHSPVNCKNCHDDAKIKKLAESFHADVNCYDCHSKHQIEPAKEFAKEQTAACSKCHTDRNVQGYKTSIHARRRIGCEGCHIGGHDVISIPRFRVSETCGRCHGQNEKSFNNSIHETVFKEGNKNAPTCTDCHGSHRIIANKMSIQSEACLKCHLNAKLFPGEGVGSAKFVAEYKTSIHASIMKNGQEAATCPDCHGNHMIQNPENPEASITRSRLPETCGKCHQDILKKYLSSAHGQALLNKSVVAPTCVDCHSEHSIKSVNTSEEFSKINQVELCLKCHQGEKLPHTNNKGEELLVSGYKDSFHYKALKEGNLNSATCSDCHGAHEMKKADDSTSRINKKNVAQTCGQSGCHTKELSQYTGSIHEVSVRTMPHSDAPTCTNCHGNHQISIITNPKGLVQLCSSCHASVELVKKYNLPKERVETYLGSYHGLAITGGSTVAAKCESCHGHHDIRPSSDPLSSINKKNLPETCGKCHPGALETFLNAPIHITNERRQTPALYWITLFYIILIVTVIGGMLLHNAVDFIKKLRADHKAGKVKA
jgi:hypothetical protein